METVELELDALYSTVHGRAYLNIADVHIIPSIPHDLAETIPCSQSIPEHTIVADPTYYGNISKKHRPPS